MSCGPAVFQALRTRSEADRTVSRVTSPEELSGGDLVLRARYADVNYKHCLAICDRAMIITEYPRIAGIEMVGEVLESSRALFPLGTEVLVHSFQTATSSTPA